MSVIKPIHGKAIWAPFKIYSAIHCDNFRDEHIRTALIGNNTSMQNQKKSTSNRIKENTIRMNYGQVGTRYWHVLTVKSNKRDYRFIY